MSVMSNDELTQFMGNIKTRVQNTVAKLPKHEAYVRQYCNAAR
jgi:Tfp pilus assembly protein PilP